jgi:thiamine kinase-like enzyme
MTTAVASPATEVHADASIAAAECGVGPRVIDYRDGWLVTEWLSGEHMTPVQLRRPQVLDELADLLSAWHASAVVLPASPLSKARRTYCQEAPLRPEMLSAVEWADEAEQAMSPRQTPRDVPCHLDVVANVLATNEGLRLIDFEYAAAADPLRELGQAIWEAELDHRAAERFVHRYAGAGDDHVAAAATWCAVAAVTWTAWGFAQGRPEMSRYARRSWERLRHHWSRPSGLACG